MRGNPVDVGYFDPTGSWCFPGFGVRVHPSGSKVYMVHKRSRGKSRRVTIGRHGVWTLDAARREAGGIVASLKNGETPTRPGAETASASGPKIAELGEAVHGRARCRAAQTDNRAIVSPHFRQVSLAVIRDAAAR